jgi:hypothetical protein
VVALDEAHCAKKIKSKSGNAVLQLHVRRRCAAPMRLRHSRRCAAVSARFARCCSRRCRQRRCCMRLRPPPRRSTRCSARAHSRRSLRRCRAARRLPIGSDPLTAAATEPAPTGAVGRTRRALQRRTLQVPRQIGPVGGRHGLRRL